MSTGGLRVNHAGLDTAAQDLSRAVQQIDDRLNRLESELAPLRSDWTGNAQQAYIAAKAKWDTAMQEMKTLLADLGPMVEREKVKSPAIIVVGEVVALSDAQDKLASWAKKAELMHGFDL